MIEKETNPARLARRKDTCEVFTPRDLVDSMLDKLPEDMFTDFTKTFCEPCAGNGNFVVAILERRLQWCLNEEDKLKAIKSIYALELMKDNVIEIKERIWNILNMPDNFKHDVYSILDNNIKCGNFFEWDFDKWCPIKKIITKTLF